MELKDLKIGMRVKIATDVNYLPEQLLHVDKKYAGEIITITSIDRNWVYVKENNLNWLPCQLEPIEKTEADCDFC